MEIHHLLASAFPHVERQLVPVDPLFFGKGLSFENEESREMRRFGCDVGDGRDEVLGNEEQMRGSLGMNVAESQDFVIFVLDLRRNFFAKNFVEDGIHDARKEVSGMILSKRKPKNPK